MSKNYIIHQLIKSLLKYFFLLPASHPPTNQAWKFVEVINGSTESSGTACRKGGGSTEDSARLCPAVPRARARGNGHTLKQQRFPEHQETLLSCGGDRAPAQAARGGCGSPSLETFTSLRSWSWAGVSGWPCSSRRDGSDGLQRSLLTSAAL